MMTVSRWWKKIGIATFVIDLFVLISFAFQPQPQHRIQHSTTRTIPAADTFVICYAKSKNTNPLPVEDDRGSSSSSRFSINRKQNRQWLIDELQFTEEIFNRRLFYKNSFLTIDNVILKERADTLKRLLKLTKKELNGILRRYPHILKYDAEKKVGPTLECLKTALELTDEKYLKKLVLKNPKILDSKKEDIQTKVDYFKSRLLLDDLKLKKMLKKYPQTLVYNLEENIQPTINWLQSRLNLTDDQVGKMIQKEAVILACSINENMEPNLMWLEQRLVYLSDPQISKMIQKCPQLLFIKKMEHNWKWLQQRLDLSDDQISKMVKNHPQLMYLSTQDKMGPNAEWIQRELSLKDTELSHRVSSNPSLLYLNIESNLAPTLNFYLKAIDTDEDVISLLSKFPVLLAYSLNKRLEPRLAEARESNLTINATFLRNMAMLSPDKWAELLASKR